MQSPLEQLANLSKSDQDRFIASLTDQEAEKLLTTWRGGHARPEQLSPEGDWDTWMILAGRGFGKTRSGAEWIKEEVEAGAMRIALIAETQKDLEEVMIEGDSGILSVFPEGQKPEYRKKPVSLKFHTGAIALGYNGTQPDQLRGPQFDLAWLDELAKYRHARDTWDMLQFGLRLGDHPRALITTTPRPIELIRSIVAQQEGDAIITKGSTFDNASNLAGNFLRKIRKRYEGTRLGRQELNAEILGDLPGALWSQVSIDSYRRSVAPTRDRLKRVVVALDIAVTNSDDSDEHGLIVAGLTVENEGLVLADESLKGGPADWARRAVSLYHTNQADCIVVEVNQGGDMVEHTIKTVDATVNVVQVRATKGKHVRAEPVAALYEQGRIAHVGQFDELEEQQRQMTNKGYEGDDSPDRLDACVWAFTELFPDITEPIEQNQVINIPRAYSAF